MPIISILHTFGPIINDVTCDSPRIFILLDNLLSVKYINIIAVLTWIIDSWEFLWFVILPQTSQVPPV